MATIETKSNKVNRMITLPAPKVVEATTIKELVSILGEELLIAKVKAQLTIDFRSMVRGLLEATDDNDDPKNSDEAILAEDFSDWAPTLRVRKSREDKAKEALKGFSLEEIQAMLAEAEAEAE